MLLVTGIEFLGLWALFDRFGSLRGWTLPEAAMFYGLINIVFSLSDAIGRGFDLFGGWSARAISTASCCGRARPSCR